MIQRCRPETKATFWPLDFNNIQKSVVRFHQEVRYILNVYVAFIQNSNKLTT